jgi:hypothetical protein
MDLDIPQYREDGKLYRPSLANRLVTRRRSCEHLYANAVMRLLRPLRP